MKYLKLFEQFRLILEKLNSQGKQLFLLCGPSATGKTYLADQIGIKHWTKTTGFKGDCLITSDGVDGEAEKITQLLEAKGCPKLAEISKSIDDGIFMIAYVGDGVDEKWLKQWKDEAGEEEKNILNPLFEVLTRENTFCPNTNQQDSRVLKLALVSYLWGPGRIVFDDIRPTINRFYDLKKEYIIYTPLTTYLSENLVKRNEPAMLESKIKKYFEWFQLSETPDPSFPDDKKYTIQDIENSYKILLRKPDAIDTYGTGSPIKNTNNTEWGDGDKSFILSDYKEIKDFITISKITDKMKANGFYFKRGGIQGDKNKDKSIVFNSRSGNTLTL